MSERNLAKGALGFAESTIMGIAGAGPTFTLAVTTGTIVAAVGTLSVASLLYCGLIMFGIMFAFCSLNTIAPDAGAAFAWVGHVFGRTWGFFAGWGLLAASVIFMVSATVPAATATLLLLAPGQVGNTIAVTSVAAIWLTVVTGIVILGIRHASYAQVIVSLIEFIVMIGLIIAAFVTFGAKPAHIPSIDWFALTAFTPQSFTSGALIAVFFYWGWDVTLNLSEETRDGGAAKGAFWAMVNLVIFFIIFMIVILIVLTDKEISDSGTNVLVVIAEKTLPRPWGYLVLLSTMLSTVGAIETQILQFSRSMFSMARAKMLHPRYAAVHPDRHTPWMATLTIWALGIVLLVASSTMPTVASILQGSIEAIGLQICFYMGITGYASAWHFRGLLRTDKVRAWTHVLLPLFGALFMTYIGIFSIPTFTPIVLAVGVGGLAIGFIPLLLGKMRAERDEIRNAHILL